MRERIWTDDAEINDMLNTPTALAGEIAKYDRIMQQRTIHAMNRLQDGLKGVMETIHNAAELASQKAEEVVKKVDETGKAQAKQQRTMVGLTWVIALATAVYVVINLVAAYEMNQANSIQRDMVAATNKAADAAIAANSIQRDMVSATNKAAQAAITANEFQRQALEKPHPEPKQK